ncbi:hypothetical protein Ocin01_13850 [Orchesella cincta]|uniref:Secreted protein n=1 Tax=Orchesella cincta TaxID=48709 RepID=A0A1D2MIV3_ORCCI|nr:hypothetical protein Ocin01_13850 [Orchesella cincta]
MVSFKFLAVLSAVLCSFILNEADADQNWACMVLCGDILGGDNGPMYRPDYGWVDPIMGIENQPTSDSQDFERRILDNMGNSSKGNPKFILNFVSAHQCYYCCSVFNWNKTKVK